MDNNRIRGTFKLDFYHTVDKDDTDTMKIVGDFVWRIVSVEDAKVLITETSMDVYVLYEDGSESLLDHEGYETIDWDAPDLVLGIEVGHVQLSLEQPNDTETVTITIED